MNARSQYAIIVVSMAVVIFIGVATFPSLVSMIFTAVPPPPPTLPNETDLFKQLQKQQLAVEKNMANFPCHVNASLQSGILCLPQDQQLINKVKGNGSAI